jgi:hypothetical protein
MGVRARVVEPAFGSAVALCRRTESWVVRRAEESNTSLADRVLEPAGRRQGEMARGRQRLASLFGLNPDQHDVIRG